MLSQIVDQLVVQPQSLFRVKDLWQKKELLQDVDSEHQLTMLLWKLRYSLTPEWLVDSLRALPRHLHLKFQEIFHSQLPLQETTLTHGLLLITTLDSMTNL
jgi:hypothetical protein